MQEDRLLLHVPTNLAMFVRTWIGDTDAPPPPPPPAVGPCEDVTPMDTAAVLPCDVILTLGLTTCDSDAGLLGNPNYAGTLVSQMCRLACDACDSAMVSLAPPPPPPPPRPACTMLQEAVVEQCTSHCDTCEVETVATQLEDCELDDGSGMAVDLLCSYVAAAPEVRQECTDLQRGVAQQCADDCSGCDLMALPTVLAGCTIDGVMQVPGETFCVSADQCSLLQHATMGRCIANCDACDHDSTSTIVQDCVVDMDVVDGGIRAEDVRVLDCQT